MGSISINNHSMSLNSPIQAAAKVSLALALPAEKFIILPGLKSEDKNLRRSVGSLQTDGGIVKQPKGLL